MKKKFKRVVAVIVAVSLLIVAVPPVQTQAAGFISPGMFFSFMSSLYGVYVQASQADNEMGAFETWLTKKVSDVKDNYSAVKEIIDAVKAGDMEKVTMSVALMTVAKEFFQERMADYGGISGGTAFSIKDSSVYIGSSYVDDDVKMALRDFVLNNTDIPSNLIFFSSVASSNKYTVYFLHRDYISKDVGYTYLGIPPSDSSSYAVLNQFDSNGKNVTFTNYFLVEKKFTYNSSADSFTWDGNSYNAPAYSISGSNMKNYFVISKYPLRYGSGITSSVMSDFLNNTELYQSSYSNYLYTVTGGYQAGTIDKLADKELSAAQLEAINSAVRTAVLDNTTTAEDDDTLVYSPDISIDLANAIFQALVDQGVITDETTGDDTGTTEPPLVVPIDPATFGIDLTKLFPFCIPFDLYDMLNVLCAEPIAPSFDWEITAPTGKKENFTIDLSVFDSVAQVVRTVELLGFCVGLAFKTRDLIRG